MIGAKVFFGSVFGEKPPLKVKSRLPASAVTGFSAAALPLESSVFLKALSFL
ncbi:MAG TPA: hypothetical protein VG448_12530 [Solirubrobacterales bacterium]|nr:hypothetical protein [Solirubrobacterales bacterium]